MPLIGIFNDGIKSIMSFPFNKTDVVILDNDDVLAFKFVYPNM